MCSSEVLQVYKYLIRFIKRNNYPVMITCCNDASEFQVFMTAKLLAIFLNKDFNHSNTSKIPSISFLLIKSAVQTPGTKRLMHY